MDYFLLLYLLVLLRGPWIIRIPILNLFIEVEISFLEELHSLGIILDQVGKWVLGFELFLGFFPALNCRFHELLRIFQSKYGWRSDDLISLFDIFKVIFCFIHALNNLCEMFFFQKFLPGKLLHRLCLHLFFRHYQIHLGNQRINLLVCQIHQWSWNRFSWGVSEERTELLEFIEVDRLLLDNQLFFYLSFRNLRFLNNFFLGLFWFDFSRFLFLLFWKLCLTLWYFFWCIIGLLLFYKGLSSFWSGR